MVDVIFQLSGEVVSKSEYLEWIANKTGYRLKEKGRYRVGADNVPGRLIWQKLRYNVLRKSDGRCSCCGRSKKEHNVVLHVDHIKPKSLYPELEFDENNLQVLCDDCNFGKGNSDTIDWR